MTGIYLTADLHLGHQKLAELRGFDSVARHDRAILDSLLEPPEGSTLYVLGDLSMGSQREYALYWMRNVKEAQGLALHMVWGNHDAGHSMHRSARRVQREYLDVFDTVGDSAVLRHNKQRILLSHFPYGGRDHTSEARYQQWRLPDRGAPLVHGHTHQSEPWIPKYKGQVCVSWEAWNQPARLDEVVQLLKEDGVLS